MKAFLKNYRQAPRKVRLVADLIKGRSVKDALSQLKYLPKRASHQMTKLVDSAVANAGTDKEDLAIKNVQVNKGLAYKRFRPGGRGRAFPYVKHSSHILIELEEKKTEKAPAKKAVKKTTKKDK